MARNGSGTYSNPYPNFVSGTVISSDEVDANNSDIATALTQSIAVDGQSTVTGNIPLSTNKLTGVGAGSAATDSLSLGQAQAEAFIWCGTAGGSADAITLSPSPAITAYAAGQRFVWMASSSVNTGATTVAISGLTAIALQDNGAALVAGNHAASKMFMGILNTTSTVQIMQVQISGTDPLLVSSLTVSGDALIGDDLTLNSDAAVLGFGVNTDVTLTHVHDTGLLLNGAMQLQFSDSSQFINAPSATVLDINATDEIELNATLVDINANLEVSGASAFTGNAGFGMAMFGAGDDLKIYHDGSDSFIENASDAGTLYISGPQINLRGSNDENMVQAVQDGAVTLYHNAIAKIATAATGVTITGEATATGFTGTLDGILGSGTPAAATVTTIDASGVATATTFEPDGDTSAADNAAIGYTAAEGLILTGQGSTNDITVKNDADVEVIGIPTGTTEVQISTTTAGTGTGAKNKVTLQGITGNDNPNGLIQFVSVDNGESGKRWGMYTNAVTGADFVLGYAASGTFASVFEAQTDLSVDFKSAVNIAGIASIGGSATGDLAIIGTSGNSGTGLYVNSNTANQIDLVGYYGGASNSINIRTGGAPGTGILLDTANLATFSGVIAAAAGSAAAPSITFSADQDSGFAHIAANNWGLVVGGAWNMYFQVTQNYTNVNMLALDAAGPAFLNESATATNPTLVPNRADLDTGVGWQTTNSLSLITAGAEAMRIDATGAVTKPLQPAFLAYPNAIANVTGNGTVYTVIWANEVYDQGSDFDGTSTFTAPVTGRYTITAMIEMTNLSATTNATLNIVTTLGTWTKRQIGSAAEQTTTHCISLTINADMDAGDTCTISTAFTGNGADTADISAGRFSQFSACLLA